MFDDFSLLIRSGLRYLVSSKIAVNAYHPLALTERLRSPVPTVHIYLDNEDLFANGDGTRSGVSTPAVASGTKHGKTWKARCKGEAKGASGRAGVSIVVVALSSILSFDGTRLERHA
eukprot:scaffold33465_cov34-Tisochrysis_lutea.AAC.1